MILIVALLAVVLLLTPTLAGLAGLVVEEPPVASFLCAAVLLAALVALGRGLPLRDRTRGPGGRTEAAFAALFGIALLSLLWRVGVDHGPADLGPMLRAWIVLAVELCLFALGRRIAQVGRLGPWTLLTAAALASAYVAEAGVTEYLLHKHAGDTTWRVFATSTPDFLAGYLVLLLPPTLALFVGVPLQRQTRPLIGYALTALLLIVLGYQVMTLLRTQSRFALVSLAVGLAVFGISLWRARRAGLTLEPSARGRLALLAVGLVLFGALFARPVLARLRHTSTGDNSTAFRLYTWRGAVSMAAHNPILGTGIGNWVDTYPRYAVAGFTRLAHNAYLQMADECGVPGLVALLATLAFAAAAGARGLTRRTEQPEAHPFLAAVAPPDDRLLLAGLLGGLAASVVQNLIDSDWYAFLIGITFWAFAGLAVGIAEGVPPPAESPAPLASPSRRIGKRGRGTGATLGQGQAIATPPPPDRGLRIGLAVLTGLMLLDMTAQGVAAWYGQEATAALDSPTPGATADAEQDLADAMQWDPLNPVYPADLGTQVYYQREGNLPDAISTLRTLVRLEPTALNESYLAAALTAAHRPAEAIAALRAGLRLDPNSIELRLTLAQRLPPPQALEYYRQITQLEDSPVGEVRALGDLVEYRFGIADVAVANADEAAGDLADAVRYDRRAAAVLEAYADEGGTTNTQRQATMGGHPNPTVDAQMQALYAHVMQRLIALSPPAQRPALQAEAQRYAREFADVVSRASQPGTV